MLISVLMPLFVLFASTFSLQKVNCPELIRLLMSYNFLAEATAVSLDYMNAFMGHGLEYFDIKVVIVEFGVSSSSFRVSNFLFKFFL